MKNLASSRINSKKWHQCPKFFTYDTSKLCTQSVKCPVITNKILYLFRKRKTSIDYRKKAQKVHSIFGKVADLTRLKNANKTEESSYYEN